MLELRPYQHVAKDFILSHDRCAIWASPGMGKTSTALSAIRDIALVEDGPALVIAPKRVARDVWKQEAHKWAHEMGDYTVVPILGTEAQRRQALLVDAPINTINYEQLPWVVENVKPWPWKVIVADESTRLKGYRTRQGSSRARALASVQKQVRHFIELTGTPAPQGLIDLWGQIWFIDGGARLGRSFTAFEQRYFHTNKYTHVITPMAGAQENIHGLLKDVCLTLDAHDYFDFKDPVVTNIYVDLSTKAYAQYRQMEKELFLRLDKGEAEAFSAAAMSNKCLQIASGAVYLNLSDDAEAHRDQPWAEVHDEKLQALESLVTELAGAPLIVAYWYKSSLARLQKSFPGARVLTTKKDEDDWNAGKIPLLLVHPASVGHGVSLQWGGHHLAWFDQIWSLELRMQLIERIGPVRQIQAGFDRLVHEYQILARHTIDEGCAERAVSKRSVQDALLLAMKRRPQ
jgi:hypothetical protein